MSVKSIHTFSELSALLNTYPYVLITQGADYEDAFPNKVFVGDKLIPKQQLQETNEKRQFAGLINYDLKNDFEALSSNNQSLFNFPNTALFEIKESFCLNLKDLELASKEKNNFKFLSSNPLESKEDYLQKVNSIQEYIREGEVYELNYCVPVKVQYEGAFNPLIAWIIQCLDNSNPFAALFNCNTQWLVCNSPERFFKIAKNCISSQPIKGTKPRIYNNEFEDAKQAELLASDAKERAENVMIVDLVRNDLARIAVPTTVSVPSLFKIEKLPTVYQMVSTIQAELKAELSFWDVLKATFPMGSMTGAPKIRAMQLIESLEVFKRNAFSGSLGYYLGNEQEADWNVVIRSLFYDEKSKELYFITGSAITIDSVADNEWEELQWKAQGIVNLLKKLSNLS